MSEQVGNSSVSNSAGRTLRHALTAAKQLFVNGCLWPRADARWLPVGRQQPLQTGRMSSLHQSFHCRNYLPSSQLSTLCLPSRVQGEDLRGGPQCQQPSRMACWRKKTRWGEGSPLTAGTVSHPCRYGAARGRTFRLYWGGGALGRGTGLTAWKAAGCQCRLVLHSEARE